MRASMISSLLLLVSAGCGSKAEEDVCDDGELFDTSQVVQVDITMDNGDWNDLREQTRTIEDEFLGDCRSGPFENDYTYFPADISINGEEASNIGIRKKGFIGSQSVDKPSFRINLDEYTDGTKLFCTDNITLNNAVQDPALMRQCLSYQVFRDAGIPAPRCNFAHVTLNGDSLGVYVNVEPVKKKFLREQFGSDEGDLYEGTVTDFTRSWLSTFEPKTDETDATLEPITDFIDDMEGSSEDLESVLSRHFDVDQLLTFLAIEAWVGHWDGYGGNQNNFFVYRDADSNKMHFIPWGTDGTMDPRQIAEEEMWFPNQGYLVQQIIKDERMANRWFDRIRELNGTAWNADELMKQVDTVAALFRAELGAAPSTEDLESLKAFIEWREESLDELMPVTEVGEFFNPHCMVEKGTIEADFSTSWANTPVEDLETLYAAGTADMRLSWDGYDIPFTAFGSFAGPVEEAEDYGNVVVGGFFEGEEGPAHVLSVFYFEIESLDDGLEVDLDWGGGSLLYIDSTTPEPVEMGEFWGGSARFDSASPLEGSAVTGSLFAGIYTWEEVGE